MTITLKMKNRLDEELEKFIVEIQQVAWRDTPKVRKLITGKTTLYI